MSTNDNTDALPPLEQQIDEYIDGYTLEGDDGYYTPNDTERLIAKDVVMGLLAEPWFVAALAAQQGAQVPHPGSPEASAMIDSVLAEYGWPANQKNAARAGYEAARRLLSASPQAPAQPEPSDRWYGAEEWMPLAWELCADECGEEACNELVWEGGPVPEPWGERWLKYEYEAKRLIALVRQHVPAASPQRAVEPLTEAARDVLAERRRQVESEGWTPEHDDEHDLGELAAAASAYALAAADEQHPLSQGDGNFNDEPPLSWPWAQAWWKVGTPRRMLEKAGALVLAAIEQIDRHAERGITKEQPKA